MNIIALKPCSFGGKQYFNGDLIPESEVLNVEALQKMGVVSVIKEGTSVRETSVYEEAELIEGAEILFNIPIEKGDETLDLAVSEEQVVEAFKTMQMSQKEATAHIRASVEDNTALILINAADSRAAVKKEAAAKAATLAGTEESAGDS